MLTIAQRQQNLRTWFYYYKASIDGIEGKNTINAYRNFQKDNGLVVDGIYGVNTDNALINNVKAMQNKLNERGYGLVVDGIVGDNTLYALKDFQRKNGLVVDGLCGPDTWNKLNGGVTPTPTNIYMTDEDWKNSKYFKKEEFKCECNGRYCNGYGVGISKKLVQDMNYIREYFGKPIIITSGVRCQTYNDSLEGSVPNSKHIKGTACDFYYNGMNAYSMVEFCKGLANYGYAYTNDTNMSGATHYNTNE